MRISVLLLVTAVGCGDDAASMPPPSMVAVPTATPAAADAPAVTNVAVLMATWPAIPVGPERAAPARPTAYPSTPGPRLVIFGGSWCGGCVSGVPADRELARRYAGRIEVGVALFEETDAAFLRSSMSRGLSGVPIWSERTTSDLADRCEVRMVPMGCLVDGDRVLWRGSAGDATAILDAHLGGRLDEALRRREVAQEAVDQARTHPVPALRDEARRRAIEALHGFSGAENSIAWELVDAPAPSPDDVALGLALAEDAVRATGGLDAAILDTYLVALLKGGRPADAARIAPRILALCDHGGAHCGEERPRAEAALSAVRGS